MIIRARSVVTMDGAPIPNGAVAVVGNKIADVGAWPELRARTSGEVIDLGESMLLPGLINAHCHLDYTDLRGAIPRPTSFASWIRAINEAKASWREEDYLTSIAHGLGEAAQFGTTTIANLEAFPALIGKLPDPVMRVWWFAEMIDVRGHVSAAETFAALRGALEEHALLGRLGLAPHAPYTASAELYAEAAVVVREHELPATTHVAESREEMAMFRDARGPLFDVMKSIGRPMEDCGGKTSLALMLERNVFDEGWIVAHLNELTDDDFRLLAQVTRKFQVVHCPRSHTYFDHSTFPLMKLRDLGFNICLGTDSLASNDDVSLFAEMQQLARMWPSLRASELLGMATTRAAVALGHGHSLGRIRPGYFADLIAIPFDGSESDVFESAVNFSEKVEWRLLDGSLT